MASDAPMITSNQGRAQISVILWRAVIVAVVGLFGWLSFAGAVASITRDGNPAAALRFAPRDSGALSARADAILGAAKSTASAALTTAGLANLSLTRQAINPRALRQLGFAADTKGDIARARRLITLSASTSRRDFGAQLWLIENGVRTSDLSTTLAHYDVALRASSLSGPILFPILNNALDDQTVRTAFGRYLKTQPSWLASFLTFAIAQSGNPRPITAAIMQGGGLPTTAPYRPFETMLLGQLAAKGAYADARAFYGSMKGAPANLPSSTAFDRTSTDPRFAPIAWQLSSSAGIEASFEPGADGAQRLHVFANSGERGVVVQKLLYLAAGAYTFAQAQTRVRFANGAAAYWELKCLRGLESIAVWRSDASGAANGLGDPQPVIVPPDCSAQSLEFTVAGGADQDGAELIIAAVTLSALRR